MIVQQYSLTIQGLTHEMAGLDLTYMEAVRRQKELQTLIRQMETKLQTQLADLAEQGIGSYPDYDARIFSREHPEYRLY